MPNVFVNVKEIARNVLPRLEENLVMPNLCYNDYSNDFVSGKGATIQVRKPVILEAKDFVAASGVQVQDVNDQTVDVTLDKFADVSVEFGAVEHAVNVDSLDRQFIEPAAVALAEKINKEGLALAREIPYGIGTIGTTPSTLAAFADAAKVLNQNKAPMTERYGVWDPEANAKFQQLGDLVNAEKSGSTEALRAGSIGKVFGLENYMAQSIAVDEVAAGAGTVLVDHSGGYAAGVKEIHVDGVTTALAAGDLLKIGDHYYTVKTAGALSTADQDITLTYGLLKAVADNAAITIATASKAAVNNIVFHKNAFAFVTRPLTTPAGVESYTTSHNGITLRVTRGYDMTYKKDMLSMDVLYGYKAIYPELAVRVFG